MLEDERAQTSVEYLLLIGAVLMFAVIVFIAVRGGIIKGAEQSIENRSRPISSLKANVTNGT